MLAKTLESCNSKSLSPLYLSKWITGTFLLPTEPGNDWNHKCRPLQTKKRQTLPNKEIQPGDKWRQNGLLEDWSEEDTIFQNYKQRSETLIKMLSEVSDL